MSIENWKIGTRLGAGLGVALIFMVGISAIGIRNPVDVRARRIARPCHGWTHHVSHLRQVFARQSR